MTPAFSNTDPNTPGHYGINYLITGRTKSTRWKKLASFRRASETIFCHDAVEHRLEGNEAGDALSSFDAATNLLEWRPGGTGNSAYFQMTWASVNEYFRHRGKCQVFWVDGHVSLIARSDGKDIPPEWYWGQPTKPQ